MSPLAWLVVVPEAADSVCCLAERIEEGSPETALEKIHETFGSKTLSG